MNRLSQTSLIANCEMLARDAKIGFQGLRHGRQGLMHSNIHVSLNTNSRASEDVYLASFPRSGNTWTRFLLAYAIWPDLNQLTMRDIANYVPDIYPDSAVLQDPTAQANQISPRIIKTHGAYNSGMNRAIIIVRDGRDALASLYHYQRQKNTPRSLTSLILNGLWSNGPWQKNVLSWYEVWKAQVIPSILIRYEDLLEDPSGNLASMLRFLGVARLNEDIDQAVEKATVRRMKESEKRGTFDGHKSIEMVRRGRSGSFNEVFSSFHERLFWRECGEAMRCLGYERP
jgi:hypothetical protein